MTNNAESTDKDLFSINNCVDEQFTIILFKRQSTLYFSTILRRFRYYLYKYQYLYVVPGIRIRSWFATVALARTAAVSPYATWYYR